MLKRKIVIATDISTTGKGGGPYTSTMNLINSPLKESYDYHIFEYKTELGRFISFKRIKDIMRQLREIKPDIVHFAGLQLSGFHIAVACKIVGIKKTIVVIHGSSTEAMNISKTKRRIIYFLESITLALVSTFYGVSRYSSLLPVTKPFLKKSSGFVYNLPVTNSKAESAVTRKELGLTEDDIVIVSVARIIKDKGYHILAQSIKNFTDTPEVKFLIVGTGDYLPIMKTELKDQLKSGQIKFLGYRNDVYKILPACNIFVLPTLHETLSISLLEASNYGLPLIASNVGGIPEIIEDGKNGFLVPPGDSQALTQAMRNISADAVMRKAMGEESKAILKDKFSEGSIIERVDTIYKKLMES